MVKNSSSSGCYRHKLFLELCPIQKQAGNAGDRSNIQAKKKPSSLSLWLHREHRWIALKHQVPELYIVGNPMIVHPGIYLRRSAFEKGSEFPPTGAVKDRSDSHMTSK